MVEDAVASTLQQPRRSSVGSSTTQQHVEPPPPEFIASAALRALPPAGACGGPLRETAREAVTWERRPETPPAIKEGGYQHYARQEPGRITKRFGSARDPPRSGPFGCKSRVGVESAAECLRSLPESQVARWKQDRAEDVYISNKREPLGTVPPRGYHLPEGLGTRTAFGIDLHVREQERLNSTKDTIFPPTEAEGAETAELYKRTHGSYGPGEQRRRDFNWGHVDPNTHRFGLSGAEASRRRSSQQQATMKQILQPELDEGIEHPPPVVSALLSNHELTRRDARGRHRLLGGGDRQEPPGHIFGTASAAKRSRVLGS